LHKIAIKERLEDWVFSRCRCGFTVAEAPSGAVYWLKARRSALRLPSNDLTKALKSPYWKWDDSPPTYPDGLPRWFDFRKEERAKKRKADAPAIPPTPPPVVVVKKARRTKASTA